MRLYESAWVLIEGHDHPVQVSRDRNNAAAFNVSEWQYDIDGRPMKANPDAPALVKILSLQAAREAGLRTDYNKDITIGL